ncbi:MAG: protein kinase, partial [Planctomycetota bacterium]
MEDEGEPILESTWDAELGAILQQYLAECGKEGQLTREQFLSKHPELAERLAACRDTIDFLLPVGANQEQKSSLPQVIGEYEILGELGRGGMGVVYEARQPSLDRIVALKVMRLGIVDPSALDRFQREAETAGGLHHTNIVPVYATGKEEDISWYAMQRIEGDSLCAKITEHYESEPQRSVPESQVAAIGIQAADALAHAHDREVIHRDIKPANLIIESSGRVWLTDFGLARRLVDVSATLSGTIIGTPRYMSPEQANLTDGEVDSRSDIYSLGATLYELATGQVPIAGDDPFQVIARIRNEDPPQPSQYREDLSKDLEAVIMKAMAKLPEDRYQNARELAEDLRAVQEHRSVQARGLSRWERFARWRRRNQAKVQQISSAAAVTAAVILSGILAWSMFWESRQGAFRLRGGGGPLTANIFKVAEGGSREYETSLTVPMQSPVNLDDADYDIQLSPLGDWSRIIRMPVIRGAFRDYRLQRSRSMRRGIPSDEGPVIPVSGFEGDAVLVKKGALLSRQSLDEKADWILDVSAIRVEQTELPAVDSDPIDKSGNEEKSGPTDRLVNFGDSAPYPLGNSLYSNTTQANAAFALRSPIDLDGDGQSDTIVAADQEPALLAINAEGEILWARECVFDPASNSSLPNWDSRWSPAVLSIINIGDINQDSIQDLIVNLVRVQPKVQTDSALVWISGKDGSVIRSLRMPKIGPAHPKWPYDGILPAQASPDRKWSVISFETDGVEQNVRAPHNTVQSERRYAVPSPLRLLQDAKTVFYQAGSACQLLDSSSGELRASFQTNLQPAMSPREIRTNSGESLLLYAGIPTGQSATQFALIALDQGGTRLWTYTSCLDMVEDTHFMLRRTAWPLVADLNGDGSDEILALPETRSDRYSHDLMLLGAADGKPMWAEPCSIFGITGLATARIVSMQDINDDGWRDLALASIGGPPTLGPSASRWFDYSSSVSRFGEVFIYIDWISGKDGQKLSWSRQRLPWLTESMWVCEIDAMRTINESKKTGTVEVAILFGGEAQTQELSGLTLRFQPNQMQAIAVANGLTPCGPPNQGSRVYRQHAGPFQDLDDKIVLATEENNSTEYLGTSEPLIAWRNADGVDFLGARANGFLNVLDPTQGKTAWYVDIPIDRYHFLQPIQWRNGSVDFFLQTTPGQAPFLLDGETGKTLWANRIRVQENVFHCQAITDPAGERLLIADDTDLHMFVVFEIQPCTTHTYMHTHIVVSARSQHITRHLRVHTR